MTSNNQPMCECKSKALLVKISRFTSDLCIRFIPLNGGWLNDPDVQKCPSSTISERPMISLVEMSFTVKLARANLPAKAAGKLIRR